MSKQNLPTILLVDDNWSDIDLAKRAFDKAKILNPLIITESGEEALNYLFCQGPYEQRDPADLPRFVLLDLQMPGLSGLEVLKRIRADEKTRRLPVVILTSSKEIRDIALGYDLGVNSYIRKPVDFHKFTDLIKQLCMYWLVLNESPF